MKHLHEQALHRQKQNQTCMASMRASETFDSQTIHRQEHNRAHMTSMRASETFQQTLYTGNSRIEYIKQA